MYVSDNFTVYRHHGYQCGCCEVIVFKIGNTSRNFYVAMCIPECRSIR